jgi:diacylglycerol kinase
MNKYEYIVKRAKDPGSAAVFTSLVVVLIWGGVAWQRFAI